MTVLVTASFLPHFTSGLAVVQQGVKSCLFRKFQEGRISLSLWRSVMGDERAHWNYEQAGDMLCAKEEIKIEIDLHIVNCGCFAFGIDR